MRFLSKLILKLFLLLVIILAAAYAGRNFILKMVMISSVERVAGLRMTIDDFTLGADQSVDVQGLRVHNPRGYDDRIMVDIPKIFVQYDLPRILKGTVYLPEVDLELKELVVVQQADGSLNLGALKTMKPKKSDKTSKASKPDSPESSKSETKLFIEVLHLKIGRVLYKDYSKGDEPAVDEFNLNYERTYRNVSDLKSVIQLIVVKTLMKTTIAALTGYDIDVLSQTISSGTKTAQEATSILQGAAQKATDQLKSTTQEIKGVLKIPLESF